MPPHSPPEGRSAHLVRSHTESLSPTASNPIGSPFHFTGLQETSVTSSAITPHPRSGSQPPNPGRINFPKRHSAGSLGKLEKGWKRGKAEGMGPGRELTGARAARCNAMQCWAPAFSKAVPDPLLDFRNSRFFKRGGRRWRRAMQTKRAEGQWTKEWIQMEGKEGRRK